MRPYTLADAVHDDMGEWALLIADDHLIRTHPLALGEYFEGMDARVTSHGFILSKGGSWDYAYSVAHEIAEFRHGFDHSAEMFAEQANILARWLKRATFQKT